MQLNSFGVSGFKEPKLQKTTGWGHRWFAIVSRGLVQGRHHKALTHLDTNLGQEKSFLSFLRVWHPIPNSAKSFLFGLSFLSLPGSWGICAVPKWPFCSCTHWIVVFCFGRFCSQFVWWIYSHVWRPLQETENEGSRKDERCFFELPCWMKCDK